MNNQRQFIPWRGVRCLLFALLPGVMDAATKKTAPVYPAPSPTRTGPLCIDTGRQLFVDDTQIERTDLKRAFHQAKLRAESPVLKAETELELKRGTAEGAVLFDGGAWFDPQDRLFKMWYAGGFRDGICYATSKDGLHWERPAPKEPVTVTWPRADRDSPDPSTGDPRT